MASTDRGSETAHGKTPRVGRGALEPFLAIPLGAIPSLAALCSGGQEWPDRLPLFIAVACLGLLAVAVIPSTAWYLHKADKILFLSALCGGTFLLALDLSGLLMVVGTQGDEIIFRRNGWDGAVLFLTFLCYGLTLWIAQILVRRHDSGREWIVASLLTFGVLYCAARAAIMANGGTFPGVDRTGFINRNAFAHFALLHASLALGIVLSNRHGTSRRPASGDSKWSLPWVIHRSPRYAAIFAAGVLALAAASTTSRGGLLTWAVVLMGWLAISRRSLSARGGLLSIIAFMVIVTAAAWFGPEVLTRFQTEHMSFATRLEVWKRCITMSLDSPFLGFGLGNFTDAFNSRYPLGGGKVFTHAEQSYLTFAIELGWVLLAALVAWLISNVVRAWTLRRDSWRTYCLVSIPLSVFLVHSLGETLWRFPAILLVVAIVLAFNRGRSSLPHKGLRRPTPGPWNVAAIAASVMLLAGAGYGYWVLKEFQTATNALAWGQSERAQKSTEALLRSSLDERTLLLRLGRRWAEYLGRSGLLEPEVQLTARKMGDELIRRQPSSWESWMLWVGPRLEDTTQEAEVIFGVRKALLCRSHWSALYVRVAEELSRYAPTLLGKVYDSLPTAQQIMFWESIAAHAGRMNRPFLAWASQQVMPPAVQSEVLKADAQFEISADALQRLIKAWQDPAVPWAQRRTIGDQVLKSIGPERWFEEFPKDLDNSFEAQLYRVNKGLQFHLDGVKKRLLEMQLPSDIRNQRQAVQFIELHVAAGLAEEAKAHCRRMLANSPTVKRAGERSESVKNQYSQYEPRAVIDLLWSKARGTGSQDVWLSLINFLLLQQEYPEASSAIRLFPGTHEQVEERKELTLYKARAAEASGKTLESLSALVQLLYLEVPDGT